MVIKYQYCFINTDCLFILDHNFQSVFCNVATWFSQKKFYLIFTSQVSESLKHWKPYFGADSQFLFVITIHLLQKCIPFDKLMQNCFINLLKTLIFKSWNYFFHFVIITYFLCFSISCLLKNIKFIHYQLVSYKFIYNISTCIYYSLTHR